MEINNEKQWIALYTKPRAEWRVYADLELHGIACFLPYREVTRKWSDRKKKIKIPLISSYVFVNITPNEYYRVYESAAVVKILTFNRRVAIVSPKEIELLRYASGDTKVTVEDGIALHSGETVEISEGVFAGYCGTIIERRGEARVALQINELGISLIVTVPKVFVKLRKAV